MCELQVLRKTTKLTLQQCDETTFSQSICIKAGSSTSQLHEFVLLGGFYTFFSFGYFILFG